ncbi:MAG TPA: pilus assembly protein PilM, partial [Tepidisphaeraceae bacterium]|nr:pilus assembly protein PilM [Tepidisphaeraceae bacterium]
MGLDENQVSVRSIGSGEVRAGNDIKHEVLTVSAENRLIDEVIENWHAIGFVTHAIDFEASAVFRTTERFIRRKDDESEVNVMLDIGHRRTQVIIGRGRELIFYKPIEVGGWQFTHAVSRKLGITFEEASTLRLRLGQTAETVVAIGSDAVRQAVYDAMRPIADHLAREVTTCLRYYSVNFRGLRPQRVRVVGGEAADPSVLSVLGGVLPVPVELGRPIANADMSAMKVNDRTGPLANWTLAFGLALHNTKGPFPDKLGTSRATQIATDVTTAMTPIPTSTSNQTSTHSPIPAPLPNVPDHSTDDTRSQAYMEAGHDA